MAEKKFALGCDVGATKVSVSLGTQPGIIADRMVDRTHRMESPDEMISEISGMAHRMMDKNQLNISDCLGICFAFAGFTNSEEGVIITSPNIKGWRRTPVRSMLEKEMKVPVIVENDADVGAYGEFRHGGSISSEDFMYMTISTGIGAGIIIGGRPYHGQNHNAGEIGHTTVLADGPKCNCGKNGCLETFSSGLGIERAANDRLQTERTSLRSRADDNGGRVDARIVFEEARKGDLLSLEIVDTACRYLGMSISTAVMLLSLSSVVIGGGLSNEGEFLRERVEHHMRKNIPAGPNENARLLVSKKPLDVVDLGALQMVFDAFAGR
ncbi:MAG: ROK family protein [Candidatus Thermoplasmatota archaeon]|nr:ROK family protein [Candidatus Sysuiplasma jiujiangense]MBX8639316.1 ROK family protein [Candidatus Sysuiplasma jiujiangense]MBX8641285.1 ROK family protein [Candidatus Sysuiplasma jiujiangense]MCL4317228.1 ROK family protein [Candidatus Thermoplasmatota archaeon]